MGQLVEYVPPGPVAKAFLKSRAEVRGIMGPIGSGKSVTCCMDILTHALMQPPAADGWARSRVIIVRNTIPELKSTSIKTWLDWFPEHLFGPVKWDIPIHQTLLLGDKRVLEVVFLAVPTPADVKKLLSFDTSWAWLNEVRELPRAVLDGITGRVGRYPSPKDGGTCYHPCVIADTNPPDDDHWYHQIATVEKPDKWEFFEQPSGLAPDAENLNFLNQTEETLRLPLNNQQRLAQGRGYYERLLAGKPKDWVTVYVNAQYGPVSSGKTVYPEFNANLHVSKTKMPVHKGMPLLLGFDFGLTPACVICQHTTSGQLRVLCEIIGIGIGLEQFLQSQVMPMLSTEFSGLEYKSPYDPAGTQRAQSDESTCRDVLKSYGLNPIGVSTNGFTARRESTAYFMNRLVGGEPAFTINPQCRMLIKGLNGGYSMKRIKVIGEERYKNVPDKTPSSHVCEALQYVSLHLYQPGKQKQTVVRTAPYKAATIAGY